MLLLIAYNYKLNYATMDHSNLHPVQQQQTELSI